MDIKSISDKLSVPETVEAEYIKTAATQILAAIRDDKLKIIDLVKVLDPVLTNGSHEIRFRGVELLTQVIESLPKCALIAKEIEVLAEFLKLRLIDHRSMEIPSLRCLTYFLDCENKPDRYSKNLMEFLKDKVSMKAMDPKSRKLIYELIQKVVHERRSRSSIAASDLIFTIVQLFENESHPENLLLCFNIISFILKNFQELDPYIDEIFEWLASYYPIDYTPSENCPNIFRADLVQALYDCFYANPLNADNLQTLLLEKLDSNNLSVKLETLECLVKCYELFPLTSIRNYTSTLWTSIRMECLKKLDLVNQELLKASYRALGSLTKCLSQDNEVYFVYVTDMYDELSIAFRKPEMELFEPAARLIAHAITPKLSGFEYVLNKVIPVSSNALANSELRPIIGLTYIFEKLAEFHPGSKLSNDLLKQIDAMLMRLCESDHAIDENISNFISTIARCKIDLTEDCLNLLIKKLFASPDYQLATHTEECLALVCLSYGRGDIISDDKVKTTDLKSLLKRVVNSSLDSEHRIQRFLIYLKAIEMKVDSIKLVELNCIDASDIDVFLTKLRDLASSHGGENQRLVSSIGHLHAIFANKMEEDPLNPLLMKFFASSYCQNLVPGNKDEANVSSHVYIPVVQNVLTSLVIRNHQLALPLINLVLNFITSPRVDQNLAQLGTKIFSSVLEDGVQSRYDVNRDYRVFSFNKQKFYMQTIKEIRIRHSKESDDLKKTLLISAVAVQVPHLPASAHRKDQVWILRELLKILSAFKSTKDISINDGLWSSIFKSIEYLIQNASSDCNVVSFVDTLTELNLTYGQTAKSLHIRQTALNCLAKLATSVPDSELLSIRAKVLDRLRPSLADKKRLVRQAAAEARLRWTLVGQPIGS